MLRLLVCSLLLWAAALSSADDYSNDSSDFTFTPDDYLYTKPHLTLGGCRFVISPITALLNNIYIDEVVRALELKMFNYLKDDGLNVYSVALSDLQIQKFGGATTTTKISRTGNMRRRSLTQNAVENTHDGRELEQTHYTTELDMEGVTIYFTKQPIPSREELMHQLQAAVHSNDDNSRITVGDEIIEEITLLWGIENYTLAPTEEPSSIASAIPSPMPSIIPSVIPSPMPSSIPSAIPSEPPIQSLSRVPTQNLTGVSTQTPTQGGILTAPSPMPSSIPNSIPSEAPIQGLSRVPTQNLTGVPAQTPTQGGITTPQIVEVTSSSNRFKLLLGIFGGIGSVALFVGGFLLKSRVPPDIPEDKTTTGGYPSLTFERENPDVQYLPHHMNVVSNQNENEFEMTTRKVNIPAISIGLDTPSVSTLSCVRSDSSDHPNIIEYLKAKIPWNFRWLVKSEVFPPAIFPTPDNDNAVPSDEDASKSSDLMQFSVSTPKDDLVENDSEVFGRPDDDNASFSSLSMHSEEVYELQKIASIEVQHMMNDTANNTLNKSNQLNPHPYSRDDLVYSTASSGASSRSDLMQFSVSTSEYAQSSTDGFAPDENWDPDDNDIDQHAVDNGEEVFSPSNTSGTVLNALNRDILNPLAGCAYQHADDNGEEISRLNALNGDYLDSVGSDDSFSEHGRRRHYDASSSNRFF